MQVDLNRLLNRRHEAFFQSTDERLLMYGGTNAGKSFSAVDKLLVQMITQRRTIRALVVRKSMPSLKKSCLYIIRRRLSEYGLAYDFNANDMVLTTPDLRNSQFVFVSINNYSEIDKVKSITDIDFVWMEEANELMADAAFECFRRLRGGQSPWVQAIMTFNPFSTNSWVYNNYFEHADVFPSKHLRMTIDDNPWAKPEEIAMLDALKDQNESLYRVYRLGEWGVLEGAIYSWAVVDDIPEGTKIVDTWYGHDFGFAQPAATVRIRLADNGDVYLQQVLYASGLTTPAQIAILKDAGVGRDLIYADNADPGRIEEMRLAGLSVLPAEKGVEDGISYVQGLPSVFVLADSVDMIKEMQGYCRQRDKNGRWLDKPVKFMDHLMDATRYGLFSHRHNIRSVSVVKEAIKPKPAPWYAPQTTVTRKAMAI